jgi:hypothetical protein
MDGVTAMEDGTAITCKSCLKRIDSRNAETLFSLESETVEIETVTEVPTESEVVEYHPTMAYVAASMSPVETTVETETETDETETGPSDAEIFRMMKSDEIAETVLTGYTSSEWIDVMLSTDTHSVDMSRGLAVERLFMTKQAARRAKREAAELARMERAARLAQAVERAETTRASDAYLSMSWVMGGLRTRGVVMTLKGETVTVESVSWVKGEGDTLETVATFTVGTDGMLTVKVLGGISHTVTVVGAIALFTEILPERSKDLMPRKFRDVMRTHRHKNSTPGDVTGNRAARAIDGTETAVLTSADLTDYAATLEKRADGIKRRTSGKLSRQGLKGDNKLTEAEKRESDRARQAAYRAAKRARQLATDMEALKSA